MHNNVAIIEFLLQGAGGLCFDETTIALDHWMHNNAIIIEFLLQGTGGFFSCPWKFVQSNI